MSAVGAGKGPRTGHETELEPGREPARRRVAPQPRRGAQPLALGSLLTVAVLGLAVFASAIGVVYVKHLTRKDFSALQSLQRKRDALQVEWGRLQLEQSTWVTRDRIENLARKKLDLYLPPASAVVTIAP